MGINELKIPISEGDGVNQGGYAPSGAVDGDGVGYEEQESPEITLPEDPETVQRLQDKLEAYRQRLGKQSRTIGLHRAPEYTLFQCADTKYKILILERLFRDGRVSTFELSRELYAEHEQLHQTAFNNACAVIEDYCETGGENAWGGDGF